MLVIERNRGAQGHTMDERIYLQPVGIKNNKQYALAFTFGKEYRQGPVRKIKEERFVVIQLYKVINKVNIIRI